VAEDTQDYNGKGILFQPHHSRNVLRGGAPRQDRGTAAVSDTSGGRCSHIENQGPCGLTPTRTAENRPVSSGPKCKQFLSGQMLKVLVMVIQQIITESNSAVLEEAKIVAITKVALNVIEHNGH
jgi:hypothetical protein